MNENHHVSGDAKRVSEVGPEADPRSLAMTRERHPERFARKAPDTDAEEIPEERIAKLEEEVEELRAQNEELARSLNAERKQREMYHRTAVVAESNEIQLNRKLWPYVDGEMARLRARNEALEREAKNKQSAS